MRKAEYHLSLLLFFTCAQLAISQNPITDYKGVSDPHIRVFNDTVFLYSGHDASPYDTTWIMKDWRVFSSGDLMNWNLERSIYPRDNYMDDYSGDCWASDAAARNGKYYFYFSDRKRGIGTMLANSPGGEFKDAIGHPLVSPMHDPTIFIEDDPNHTPYLIYGDKEGGGFHIAKLADDMISLAEDPKAIIIEGEKWENAPDWMDKNYLFKRKDTYYLSWGRDYAVSKTIYGPYHCIGAVGHGHHLSEFAHGSFFWWKGQFYHVWCYYIQPGFKYRETVITYCHFDDEGRIVTDVDFLNTHFSNGVGQYSASWSKIEAEWYYEISSEIEKRGNSKDGFRLTNIQNGSWLRFSNMKFEEKYKKFIASATFHGENGTIEIRTDSLAGEIIGKAPFDLSIMTNENHMLSCKLKHLEGMENLYLIFHCNEGARIELDWFKFMK